MKPSKRKLSICLGAIVAVAVAIPAWVSGQTIAQGASKGSSASNTQWSIQVETVEPGEIPFAYSFQIATYESLVEELNKTHHFNSVFREGDRKAGDVPNLLVLKTTVVKYTAGSETRREVTTFSGATKVWVRTQLFTRDGKIVLDRTLDGKVRFFGSNLRATHNLARNVAKMIEQSPLPASDQAVTITAPAKLNADSPGEGHS